MKPFLLPVLLVFPFALEINDVGKMFSGKLTQLKREVDRVEAEQSFNKWTRHYKVSPKKMFRVFDRETRGRFNRLAFNEKTCAMGVGQLTEQALRDIPEGDMFFKWETTITSVSNRIRIYREKVLDKRAVFNINNNIRAACSYMAICERRAPKLKRELPRELRILWSEEKISVLMYCWGIGHIKDFISVLRYTEGF